MRGGAWIFNPDESHLLSAGNTLVVMTNPEGREALERRLKA